MKDEKQRLKDFYRKKSKQLHPDLKGGDAEAFINLRSWYEGKLKALEEHEVVYVHPEILHGKKIVSNTPVDGKVFRLHEGIVDCSEFDEIRLSEHHAELEGHTIYELARRYGHSLSVYVYLWKQYLDSNSDLWKVIEEALELTYGGLRTQSLWALQILKSKDYEDLYNKGEQKYVNSK